MLWDEIGEMDTQASGASERVSGRANGPVLVDLIYFLPTVPWVKWAHLSEQASESARRSTQVKRVNKPGGQQSSEICV